MKVSKLMKMLPVMLVACMLLSSVSAFAAVTKPGDIAAATEKVTVVVTGMQQDEEVAIMVYDKNDNYTSPADVAAADILYIDQAPATVLDSGEGATTYGVTFEFYLKDGASDATKTVAIGSATASAVTYETFDIKKAADYVIGNVDGDAEGSVNNKDLMILRRHLAGGYTITTFIEQAADIDGDGTVGNKDLMILRRHLAGGYPAADAYFEK